MIWEASAIEGGFDRLIGEGLGNVKQHSPHAEKRRRRIGAFQGRRICRVYSKAEHAYLNKRGVMRTGISSVGGGVASKMVNE